VQLARAARLDEFDQLPDWVTPEAYGAILAHTQGGRNRLHLLLATALLIAEKENRDNIDLALVQRAVSLQPQVEPVHVLAVPATGVRHHPIWLLAASFAIACALLATYFGFRLAVHTKAAAPAVHVQAMRPAPKPARPVAAPVVPARSVPAPVAIGASGILPHPAAPPATPHPARTAAAWQPAEPSPAVLISASAAAQQRAQQLQALLAAQGWQATAAPHKRFRRGTWAHYFYAEDRDAANRVARAALPSGVVPSLVPARHGHAAPPPGTIEIHID